MKGLSLLQYYLKFSSNKLGLHNINKACEQFFADLFNVLWDKNYKRLEHNEKNYPGIDLADEEDQSSIQITADGSKDKLWYTLDKFEEHDLYNEHNKLIHFVVGEKHFTPRKSDRYQFVKSKFNVYEYNRVLEDGNQYKIQIWDIMDILCLIDSSDTDSSTVSSVRDYISNNLNEQIETFKQDLYPIESKRLIPFTAKTFIEEYFQITEQNKMKEIYISIERICEILNDLEENARIIIYKIVEEHQKSVGTISSDICVSMPIIKSKVKASCQKFNEDIKLLLDSKLLDEDELSEGRLYLQYYANEENLLQLICFFCIEHKKSLRDLIIKPDFSLLN